MGIKMNDHVGGASKQRGRLSGLGVTSAVMKRREIKVSRAEDAFHGREQSEGRRKISANQHSPGPNQHSAQTNKVSEILHKHFEKATFLTSVDMQIGKCQCVLLEKTEA